MTKDELIKLAEDTGRIDQIDKRWGAKRIAARLGEKADDVEVPAETAPENPVERESAQSLAMRIWEGQSPDLNRKVRIARIEERLENKGYDVAGIEYPG